MSRSTRTIAATSAPISRRRLLKAALAAPAAGALSMGGALSLVGALGSSLLPTSRALAQPGGAAITTTDLGGLFLLQGAGCNVLALPGPNGALMVDGGLAANAERLLAAVFAATGASRVDTLVNTHWHPEQTGANERVGSAGGRIFAHEKTAMYLGTAVYSAVFDGRLAALPEAGRPTETVRGDGVLEFAGESIDVGYLPAAHTDGDIYLRFREQNVVAAGGVVSAERWPLLDFRNGAWYGGRVRAVQWLADLVEPSTRVVPADGRVLTGAEIVRQRDIYLELFETLIGYMNRGFGPEDAARENPLAMYEDEFGDAREFLYGAYRSMLIAYVPD